MIDYKNLNDVALSDILSEYKKQIGYLTEEWTNQQESDPGITLVELFAWLKSVQHEYLNRLSDGVRKKFLEILGITREKNRGAKTILTVSNLSKNVTVPVKTKWRANNMIFENPEIVNLTNAKILSLAFQAGDKFGGKKVVVESYKFDGDKTFCLFGDDLKFFNSKAERCFTINLSDSLPSNQVLGMYFKIYTEKGFHRVPIPEGEKFDEIAKVSFQYYGSGVVKNGWNNLDIIKDETHNFLYSGVLKFRVPGEMLVDDEGYYKIRVRLLHSEYDFPPKITNIYLNTFEVVQNDCKCEKILIKKGDFKADFDREYLAEIANNLAIYGEHFVYIKQSGNRDDSWLQEKSFSCNRDFENGKLVLKVPKGNISFEDFSDNENVVMLVCYEKSLKKSMILGSGTGASQQYIDFDTSGLLYGGTEVLVGRTLNGTEYFYVWNQADDFFSSNKYDRHFVLVDGGNIMAFGDHVHGQAPNFGENNIRLCALNKCSGTDSNIKAGLVNNVITENSILKNARVTNITDAMGGRNNETFKHAELRASECFNEINRAVTLNDYYKIVKSTPGIVFKNIKILPNYMKNTDTTMQNCVTVAINCRSEIGAKLPLCYKKNVMRQLEKYRLINTKIAVIGAEYIGIILSGEIYTNSYFNAKEKAIENAVEKYFENLNKEMGTSLIFGDIFGILDRLNCVDTISSLNITPVGKFIEKTTSEDIVVPPNAVYYIKDMNFAYIKSNDVFH